MPKFSIVMPFLNKWDLTHQRLMDFHKFIREDVEVILVNDASTENDCDGGIAWWQQAETRYEIRYIKNKENLGFGGSMNRGAERAKGDILVFYSNDVIASGNFLEQIKNEVDNDPNILIGGRTIYWDTGWNLLDNTIFPYAEGWLLACTKEIWDNLGGFDPRYAPYDFEDLDLSATAIERGYRLVGLDSPYLKHLGGQTAGYNEKRLKITNRNKKLFYEKWSSKVDLIGEANQHAR